MAFIQKEINGYIVNQSDKTLQWKIINDNEDIKVLSFNKGITTTVLSAFSSTDFLEIIDYINKNNLNINSIELTDKQTFLNNALIGNKENNIIINFINNLNFND